MRMSELTKKHLERLPLTKDGYKIGRLKTLFGKFVAYYDGKKVGDEDTALKSAQNLEKFLLDKYPDIKTPLLYHPEDKSNNLSVSDSEGEYMSAELKQL